MKIKIIERTVASLEQGELFYFIENDEDCVFIALVEGGNGLRQVVQLDNGEVRTVSYSLPVGVFKDVTLTVTRMR